VISGTIVAMPSDTTEDSLLRPSAKECAENDGKDPEETKEVDCLKEEDLCPMLKEQERDRVIESHRRL